MINIGNNKYSVNRLVLELFLPGFFATFPYIYIIFSNPKLHELINRSDGLFLAIVFAQSLAIGMVLEDIGTRVEDYFDKFYRGSKGFKDYDEVWDKYLKLKLSGNSFYIGENYISKVVNMLKFELSFSLALIPMSVGLLVLNAQESFISNPYLIFLWFVLLPLGLSCYLIFEARSSVLNLHKERKRVIEACKD